MNALQSELKRLYAAEPASAATHAVPEHLVGPDGTVRALVLELRQPPDWLALSAVWQGVQADLGLPAPAIAVSGRDGLQLWFSLAEPVPAARAHAFLALLRQRFLPDVEARRVHLMPAADAAAQPPDSATGGHARRVPACQEDSGNWSAFVAPDLAPIFADTPWLDMPPSEDGQANLLRGLATVPSAEFEAAMVRLAPRSPAPGAASPAPSPAAAGHAALADAAEDDAPRRFLLQAMHDETVPMALRIEAARVLLQHPSPRRG